MLPLASTERGVSLKLQSTHEDSIAPRRADEWAPIIRRAGHSYVYACAQLDVIAEPVYQAGIERPHPRRAAIRAHGAEEFQ